jgi:glycosyltransferase involved in cell wall biosynthesis
MKVLILIYDSMTYDTRAMQQRKTLQKAGYEVTSIFINPRNSNQTMDIIYQNDEIKTEQPVEFKYIGEFDIIHAHFLAGLNLANKLNKKHKAKIVYDMLEFWRADSNTMVQQEPLYTPFENNINTILVEGKPMYDFCRPQISKDIPMHIVHNTKPLMYKKYCKPDNEKFTFIFLGCISESRFIREAIEVIEEFNNVRLILGVTTQGCTYKHNAINLAKEANNTNWIGEINCKDVIPMTRKADCVLCMINANNFNNRLSLANKQFEAMLTGRPVVCSENTYSGYITTKYNTGIVIPHDKESLRRAIKKLIANESLCKMYGEHGLQLARERFNWNVDEKVMLKAYKEL